MQDHRCLGTIGSLLLPPPRSHTFLRANTKAERDFRQEHGLCLFGPMLFVVCCRCAARQATARRPGVYVGNMNSHKEILVSAVSGLNTKIYPMDIFHFDFWRERKIFIAAQNINTQQWHGRGQSRAFVQQAASYLSIQSRRLVLHGRQIHEDEPIGPFHTRILRNMCSSGRNSTTTAQANLFYLSIRMSTTREASTPPTCHG